MKKNRTTMFFALAMLVIASLACQFGGQEIVIQPAAATAPNSAPVQPTQQVAADPTDAPAVQPINMQMYVMLDDIGYGRFANDALLPQNLDVSDCVRLWQAMNPDRNGSKNATWIALVCDPKSSAGADTTVMFVQPWEMHVSGKGQFSFVLIRDLRAVEQLKARNQWNGKDPYDVSVQGDWSKQSKVLSVYWKGSGKILDAENNWVDMTQSFYQEPFAKDFADGYIFHFDFGSGGNANIWIGSSEFQGTVLHSQFDLPVLMAK